MATEVSEVHLSRRFPHCRFGPNEQLSSIK